jgi:uncharacterized membrane protein
MKRDRNSRSTSTSASPARTSRIEIVFNSAAALIALIGLGESTYLTVIALTGETAVCGASADCFKVLGSSYAKIGGIPVASLGALAYFSVFTFAIFAAFAYSRARKFMNWTVMAMFAMTLWLLYVQAFRLHAFCKYCLFSAALIFLLMGLVVARPSPTQQTSRS